MTTTGETAPLACPKCGGSNLHHREVQIYTRKQEDAPGQRVCVNEYLRVEVAMAAGGFAGRRNDIRIQFSCETCPAESWLFIIQHVDSTYLQWEDSAHPNRPRDQD